MPPTTANYVADRTRLIDTLHAVRRRVRMLGVVFGAGVVVACTVGVFLLTMFIDWALDLPSVPRLLFMIAAVGGIGFAAYEYIVKPLLARLTVNDIAGKVESTFPVFDDRLRSTVNFADTDVPGSDVMKQRTVAEAVRLAQQVDLNQVVVSGPAFASLAWAGAVIAFAGMVGFLAGPEYLKTAFSHLNPFSDRPWPRQYEISASSLPSRVPVGQRIDVKMKLTKGDKPSAKAIVYYQYDNGPVMQEYMTRAADGSYLATLDAKGENLKIWMKSGDGETKPATVNVVPRLAIRDVSLGVTPPSYAKLGSTTLNLVNLSGQATFGSELKLQVGFNKPLDAAQPVVIEAVGGDAKAPAAKWDRTQPAAPVGTWQAKDSLRFRIHATDTDGFQNTALEEFELLVQPDRMPTVTIRKPQGNESKTAEAVVHLVGHAEDDFGLRYGKLVIDRIGRASGSTTQPAPAAPAHWEIQLTPWTEGTGSGGLRGFENAYEWELSKLAGADLKPGDVLEYFLQVQDNFELGGQFHPPVNSGRLRINIISQEELTNAITDAARQVADKVQTIQNAQKNAKEATRQLQQDTKDKPEFTKGDRDAAEKRINDQSAIASQTKTLAKQVEGLQQQLDDNRSKNQELKDLTNDVKDQLNDAAEKPMKDAAGKLNEANQQKANPQASPEQQKKDSDRRNEALEKSQASQQKAAEQLQKTLDRMSSIGTLSKAIENWQKLLDKQKATSDQTQKVGKDNLGKKPEDMSKEDRDKLAKAAEDQKKLAEQTDKATAEMQKTAEQMAKSDPAAAEAMKEAAKQAQSQQIAQKQQQAAQQAQQNQQSQAQNNQKQAEFGLQVVIDTLREAERRKLEQLIKKLDDAQKAIANLIRRQAGHNVDNLGLQGGEKAKLVTDELLAKAERVKEHLPPLPDVPQLTGGQEQTERNTSDTVKSVGDIQGAAEAVANLTRAASKMGYAIIGLRDKKLPEAYDPNQTEALSSLEAALQSVALQKQAAQDKKDAGEKEKLREAYVKIRDEQVKVNEQTTKLDKGKNPDGTLKHADQVALGQLPGQQGKLADKTDELSKNLTGSSVVYVWANRDIVTSMKEVKDDLNKPDTGVPTQAEQVRIVEQLQAMIDNLAIKPPEKSPFAQKNNGGQGKGGGQKKNKLPTEAELRMLKDLQLALNKSTQKIDAEPVKDKPKLVALGNRQGQFRNLLDQLLQSASEGQIKLPPEPDKKDQLPEEATNEAIEDQELAKNLLEDKPLEDKAQKDTNLIGDRMARVRQRLSDSQDPGKTTQKIEEKIVFNIDQLIELARESQKQAQGQGEPKPGEGPKKPGEGEQADNQGKPGEPKPGQPQPGQTAAQQDSATAANENNANLKNDMKETADNWGTVSPRLHDAIVEGAGEKVPQKYRKLVEDYYRSLSTKASGQGK